MVSLGPWIFFWVHFFAFSEVTFLLHVSFFLPKKTDDVYCYSSAAKVSSQNSPKLR